jgi:hypothetical protein
LIQRYYTPFFWETTRLLVQTMTTVTGRPLALAVVLVGWLAIAASVKSAELSLEVIELRYRTVEQLLPILQPLVQKPGTVSGMHSSLIVRTTPANLAEIRRVLDAVDRAPRRLMITVRQDADANRSDEGVSVSASIGTPRARVTLPGGDAGDSGAVVQARRGDDRARARVYSTQSLENDRTTQQVQVIEGSEALIRVGQSVPVPSRSVVRRVIGGRVVEQTVDTVDYRDALTGFLVRPRLAGEVVTLELSPQRDTLGTQGPGSINVQRVSTTVSGRLGEWIEIGGIVSGRAFEASGTAYRTNSAAGDDRRVLVKVDEIP